VLVASKEKEPLLLYIAATHQVVSTVLIVEQSEEGKMHGVQWLVYFFSEVLSPTKQRYPHYQKLAYSIFTTTQKLWQYFVVHPIIVVNEASLSNILNNPAVIGHVSLWGIELLPLDITYEKRKAIKSQVLPDFTAEWLKLQNTGPPDFVKCMDNVLLCIKKGPRHRRRSSLNITTRRQTKICAKDEFSTSFQE
jgi:hypothetical protein